KFLQLGPCAVPLIYEDVNAVSSLVFSNNGTLLISRHPTVSYTEGKVCFWEVASGQLTAQINCDEGWLSQVTASPDGKWVAWKNGQYSVAVWDMPTLILGKKPDVRRLTIAELESQWAQLAADAISGQRAIWSLAAIPDQAVALLQERLRP